MTQSSMHISHSAYMNDTIWINKDFSTARKTIAMSNEFFQMNDVKINGSKSELLVINSKKEKEEQGVYMGTSPLILVRAAKKREAIRFLGIWIREKSGFSHIIAMATDIVREF